jgi:hypothetical protein
VVLDNSPRNSGNPNAFAGQEPVAEFLGLSTRTLERLRLTGGGPPFRKFGRRVLYQWRDVLEWANRQRRTSTSDMGEVA